MKKIRTWFTLMLLAVTLGAFAQYPDDDTATKGEKPATKLTRQQRKAMQQAIDSMEYADALQALRDTCFTLEADQVVFKYGHRAYVSPTTNFVAVEDGRAVAQVAFNIPAAGPNGIGGVTVEGPLTDYKMTFDKKGNMMLTANVMGVSLSARLYITMCKGSNKASIEILPTFNSRRITLEGVILPPEKSFVIKGRTLPYPMH